MRARRATKPRRQTPTTAGPLDRLLQQLADRGGDPLTRTWAKSFLVKGEAASDDRDSNIAPNGHDLNEKG
jgi:hypothetical protein